MSMSHEAPPPEAMAGEAAPDRQIRLPCPIALADLPGTDAEKRVLMQFLKGLVADYAHLEFANGCLQERLAALEDHVEAMKSTIGQVVTLAAAVDSAGLESVGGKMGRMAAMEAKRAEVASRCDMGDVGPEGRLTPCPVSGCGLGGGMGDGKGIGGGGACQE